MTPPAPAAHQEAADLSAGADAGLEDRAHGRPLWFTPKALPRQLDRARTGTASGSSRGLTEAKGTCRSLLLPMRQCDGERVGSAGWLVSMLPDQALVVAVAFHAARWVPQKRPGVT